MLAALWLTGAPRVVPDLRFSAPVVAQPGTTIGFRAWQVDEDDEGNTVILAPPVSVEIRNAAGLTLGKSELESSLVEGREGRLQIPKGLDGVLRLVAIAQIDGHTVSVERSLYVRDAIESRLPAGRSVNAFQVYELGPLRSFGPMHGTYVVDPRIEEGACVPDLRCWLSVWVGDQAVEVRVRSLTGARIDPSIVRPSNQFARFPLLVVGNEARVDVQAIGPGGAIVATREARLPIVPGGIVARASSEGGAIRVDWEQLGGPHAVLVDVLQGRRWTDAVSLSPEAPYLRNLGPGVWRLQVRADLLSENTAGVTYAVIAAPGGPDRVRQAVNLLMDQADQQGLDPLAMAFIDGDVPDASADDLLRALFAIPSFDVVSLGPGSSSRVGDDQTFDAEQERRRWQTAAAILLIGLLVSMVLLRVELLAQARARRLLEDLGDEPPPIGPRVSSGRGLWAFVLLVFVLMAVLALSKRWF